MESHQRGTQAPQAARAVPHSLTEPERSSAGKGLNIWREPPSASASAYKKGVLETLEPFRQLAEVN